MALTRNYNHMKCPVELKVRLHTNEVLLVWHPSSYRELTIYKENLMSIHKHLLRTSSPF